MSNSDIEEYAFIEEEEVEIPEIDPETEWAEFGNIPLNTENIDDGINYISVKKQKLRKEKFISRNVSNEITAADSRNLIPFKFSNAKKDCELMNTIKRQDFAIFCVAGVDLTNVGGTALLEGNALFDGTFFSFIAEYYLENTSKQTIIRKFKGKCEICENPVYIIGTGTSTYNFLRHLRRIHGEKLYESYISYKKMKNSPANRKFASAVTKTENLNTSKNAKITVYVAAGNVWEQFGSPRTKRPFSSIILADDLAGKILNDVHEFMVNSTWYHERAIPYRRTYLLYGPSGCGKTSFVFALAGVLNSDICVLHASNKELTDEKLSHLLSNTPDNCIILLEDIGCAFSSIKIKNKLIAEESGRLTLSGICNSLDGIMAPEGKIIFMTSVDFESLDPMLLRPGRVDMKEYFGYCNENQIVSLYQRFYMDCSNAGEEFAQEVLQYGKPITAAQIQGYFLRHKHSILEELKININKVWDE